MKQNNFAIVFCLALGFFVTLAHSVRLGHGPPEDELDWIDNTLVPDRTEPGTWWAPSRKAHFYAHKYKSRLENDPIGKVGEDLRLPTDILPSIYTVQLLPFIEEGNFTTHGSVEILVDCQRATRNISMNAAELTIDQSSITVKIN